MGNHQIELASQLAEDGHLCYATCRCEQISVIYTIVSIFTTLTNLEVLSWCTGSQGNDHSGVLSAKLQNTQPSHVHLIE